MRKFWPVVWKIVVFLGSIGVVGSLLDDLLKGRKESNLIGLIEDVWAYLLGSTPKWVAVTALLVGLGLGFAVSRCFRRRVASLVSSENKPLPITHSSGGPGPIKSRCNLLMAIDEPKDQESFPAADIAVRGRFSGSPGTGKRFALFTRRGKEYWPQGRLLNDHDDTWRCTITEKTPGETTILACQVDDAVYLWIDGYVKTGMLHDKWVGLEFQSLPDSIRVDQSITIKVVR